MKKHKGMILGLVMVIVLTLSLSAFSTNSMKDLTVTKVEGNRITVEHPSPNYYVTQFELNDHELNVGDVIKIKYTTNDSGNGILKIINIETIERN